MKSPVDLSWQEFYKDTINFRKFLKRIMCNLELIYLIIKQQPRSVIEIGTGTGALSAFISWFVPTVIALDNDKEVIKRAKTNCKTFGREVNFIVADAFFLPFKNKSVSLCFSQGFFEHFQDEEIRNLTKEQIRISEKTVLFNVPSDNYPAKPFGNERLLSPKEWLKIINLTKLDRVISLQIRYCHIDVEAFKHFFVTGKWRGFFEILGFLKIIHRKNT